MPIKIQELVFQVKVQEESSHNIHTIDPFKLIPQSEEELKRMVLATMNHFFDEHEER